jgi:hypothetical protein
LACLVLVAGGTAGAAADERQPNAFERAYTAIALDFESHEPCTKISPRAVTRAPFNSPGTRVYLERARCFLSVAHRTLNPYFCREVAPASETPVGGRYFTRENCQALVGEGRALRARLSFDHALLLKVLGYTDEDVRRRFPKHPEEDSWMLFYHDFFRRSDGELQHRLGNLPNFSAD